MPPITASSPGSRSSAAARRWRRARGLGRLLATAVVMLAGAIGPARAWAQPAPAEPGAQSPAAEASVRHLRWAIRVLNGDEGAIGQGVFSAALLKETPASEIERMLKDFASRSGGVKTLELRATGPRAARAWLRARLSGEDWTLTVEAEEAAPHAIDRFVMAPAPLQRTAAYPGWAVLDADLTAFAQEQGRSAAFACFEVAPDGTLAPVHALAGDRRLSIGTAAMVFVLGAVAEAASEGLLKWDQPLALDPGSRSYPESRLGQAPTGSERPVSEYARLMIAEGDHTAADHLIGLLGRDRIERRAASHAARPEDGPAGVAPGEIDPFLTTGEFYRLKCAPTADLMRRYAVDEPAGRRLLLETDVPRTRVLQELMLAWRQPQLIDKIGWFASPEMLCREMAALWSLGRKPGMEPISGAFRVEGAPAAGAPLLDSKEWTLGWLATGGEPGVFTAAWALERSDGRVFVMAMIFNNTQAPLEVGKLQPIITATGRLLANQK